MKRQINIAQMKEQTRNTQVQKNEEEIGKVPGKQFRKNARKDDPKILKIKWKKCNNSFEKT